MKRQSFGDGETLADVLGSDELLEGWELFLTRSHKHEEAEKGLDSTGLVLLGTAVGRKKGPSDPAVAVWAKTSVDPGTGNEPSDSKGHSNPFLFPLNFESF